MEYTAQEYKALEEKYEVMLKKYEALKTEMKQMEEEYDELVDDFGQQVEKIHNLEMEKMKWEQYVESQVRKNSPLLQ